MAAVNQRFEAVRGIFPAMRDLLSELKAEQRVFQGELLLRSNAFTKTLLVEVAATVKRVSTARPAIPAPRVTLNRELLEDAVTRFSNM